MLHYEISLSAEEDWREIVNYTLDQHGEIQTRKYMQELIVRILYYFICISVS